LGPRGRAEVHGRAVPGRADCAVARGRGGAAAVMDCGGRRRGARRRRLGGSSQSGRLARRPTAPGAWR
jgi:hypothetical protein